MKKILFGLLFVLAFSAQALADELVIRVSLVNEQGIGKEIGTVMASDSKYGLILKPQLGGLTAGVHGFHIHDKPTCAHAMKDNKTVPASAAGGHHDPANTGKHEGPYGSGHLGDLPVLYVTTDGKATTPVLAPRLKVADLKGRSLMIHAGSDNYTDTPEPLGGGGARIACGIAN